MTSRSSVLTEISILMWFENVLRMTLWSTKICSCSDSMLSVRGFGVYPESSETLYAVWDNVLYNSDLIIIWMCLCCPPLSVVGSTAPSL